LQSFKIQKTISKMLRRLIPVNTPNVPPEKKITSDKIIKGS
jgi:hypothetical protein